MLTIAALAFMLWPVHYFLQLPYYEAQAEYHGLMAGFCEDEAELFTRRAELCRARARMGAPWNDPSEEAETLKCCPYLSDAPRYSSWLEQAVVWERAAAKAKRAAQWHASY
jgi:hypothetical protein